jgi:hypothetical protein
MFWQKLRQEMHFVNPRIKRGLHYLRPQSLLLGILVYKWALLGQPQNMLQQQGSE